MSTVEHTRTGAPPRRVLVTGSRTWANPAVIRDALQQVWGDGSAVLVTGASPRGADRIAEMFWRRWGGTVERHPADWQLHGRQAGFNRNAEMVRRGADICVAFIRDASPGASHTVQLAEHAGIPVYLHTNTSRSAGTGQATDDDPARSTEGAAGAGAQVETPACEEPAPADPPTEPARTAAPVEAAGSQSEGRAWLDVPYRQKNEAKKLGARWDQQARRWYAPDGITEPLSRWAPGQPPAKSPFESPSESTASEPANPSGNAGSVPRQAAEQAIPGPDDLVSPAEVAALYSYPEIAARVAKLPPDSDGGRQARAAMALLLDNPGLYEGGDQAEAIARQFSAEEINRHREIVGHGPLFDMLGQAAQVQRDAATPEAADTPHQDDAAGAAPTAADEPAGEELLSPAELATHYPYPEISALLANAPDAETARIGREALGLLLDNPGLYAGGDQADAIARQFSAEEINRHREIVGHGPLFETLGRAAELQHNTDAVLADAAGNADALEQRASEAIASGDAFTAGKALHEARQLRRQAEALHTADTDPAGRDASEATGDAGASVSRARQAVDDAQSVLNAQRGGDADEERRRQIAVWNQADEIVAGRDDDQGHGHDDGGMR